MDRDYRNQVVSDARWRRLKKYQKDVLAARYAALEEEIRRLCGALGIPDACARNAAELARRFVGRGHSPQALAAAALFLSCRMLKAPRPLDDFADYVENLEKMRRVVRELSLAAKNVPKYEHYVAVIVTRLGVPASAAKNALELLQRNRKALQGRNPWAAAAAALWLSGVDMASLRRFASPSAIKNIVRVLK
jgi:transcription initiation factor TFIIB